MVQCGDDGDLSGFNETSEGVQESNEALFSAQMASHARSSNRSSSFKRENLSLPHRTSHKQKRMQTIREENIANMPDNQALTDSCGDDSSPERHKQHMRKLDSESFPAYDSGIRPSTT